MEKFLSVPVYDLLVSGTSDAPTGAGVDLEDAAVNFNTSGVTAGDIVHNSTDNEYFVVDEVLTNTELALSALDGGTLPIPTGKDYFIHSSTSSNNQLISAVDVLLVEQSSTSTVSITYDSPSTSTDVIGITHSPVPSGSEAVRDMIQDKINEAYASSWTNVSHDLSTLPYYVIGIRIT